MSDLHSVTGAPTAATTTGQTPVSSLSRYRLHAARETSATLHVGLLGAAPLVERGVEEVLGEQGHRLRPVASREDLPAGLDAVLVDVWSLGQRACAEVAALIADGVQPVLCLGWGTDPEEWQRLRDAGAHGHVSMALPTASLVAAVEQLLAEGGEPGGLAPGPTALDRVGCTEREAEILTLIAHGLSNKEISAELFLGLNTIKTYIRSAYRKIGVTTRSHAVIWGIEHGI